MKNKKSRIIIVLVTAGLTFGTLFAVKGESYKHRFNKHQCGEVDQGQTNENGDVLQQKERKKHIEKAKR